MSETTQSLAEQTVEPDIMPCWKCGSDADVRIVREHGYYFVECNCNECGLRGQLFGTLLEAINDWNGEPIDHTARLDRREVAVSFQRLMEAFDRLRECAREVSEVAKNENETWS